MRGVRRVGWVREVVSLGGVVVAWELMFRCVAIQGWVSLVCLLLGDGSFAGSRWLDIGGEGCCFFVCWYVDFCQDGSGIWVWC